MLDVLDTTTRTAVRTDPICRAPGIGEWHFRARMLSGNIALPTDGEAGAPNSLVALVR